MSFIWCNTATHWFCVHQTPMIQFPFTTGPFQLDCSTFCCHVESCCLKLLFSDRVGAASVKVIPYKVSPWHNNGTAPVKIAFTLVIIARISLFIFMRLVFPKQCNSASQLYSLLESCCNVSFSPLLPWSEGKDKRIKRRDKKESLYHTCVPAVAALFWSMRLTMYYLWFHWQATLREAVLVSLGARVCPTTPLCGQCALLH